MIVALATRCRLQKHRASGSSNTAHQSCAGLHLQRHRQAFGRGPWLYGSDRGFFSEQNLASSKHAGVKLVCIPQRGGKAYESSAAFKNGQRFRAGIEGRISVLFRGRGMKRCLAEGRDASNCGLALLCSPTTL
jgi:hypothetical protein